MSGEQYLNAFEFLQCQYLCCKPVKLIDWQVSIYSKHNLKQMNNIDTVSVGYSN